MNRLALELLALVSTTPQPALDLAAPLGVPVGGKGSTVRNLCRLLRRRGYAVHFAFGRSEVVQTLLPEPPHPAVCYVWLDPADWPRVRKRLAQWRDRQGQGIACRWCGSVRPMFATRTARRKGRVVRARVCRDCGKTTMTEERRVLPPYAGSG